MLCFVCAGTFHSAVKGKLTQSCLVLVMQNADLLTWVFKHREAFFELELNMWEKNQLSGKVLGGRNKGRFLKKLNVPSDLFDCAH